MLEKLKEIALRYEDLQAQLADPGVYGDAVRLRDVTREEEDRTAFEKKREQTLRVAQEAVDRQMRMVQQVARLLGETTGETKAALLRMEQAVKGEKHR